MTKKPQSVPIRSVNGIQLKEWRSKRKISQRALAEKCDLGHPTILFLETGEMTTLNWESIQV